MKITSFNYSPIRKQCFQGLNHQSKMRLILPNFIRQNRQAQSCDIDIQIQKENEFFNNFLKTKGKVTLEQYENVKQCHPRALLKAYEICDRIDGPITRPYDIARYSIALKDYYQKLYDGNYTIVSIGTSPAPITEVMQNLGCKVIFLPISSLSYLDNSNLYPLRNLYPTIASRHHNIDVLMQYATKKGINKKDAGTLVVLDFSKSGRSLENMRKILEERKDIDSDRIKTHSLIADLAEIAKGYNDMNITERDTKNLGHDLVLSEFENIINVPHFTYDGMPYYGNQVEADYKKSSVIFDEFDNFSTPFGRAWSLVSLHEAMKMREK